MGDSDKLEPSGPDRYSYLEHRDCLFGLWDQLGLDDGVILVCTTGVRRSASTGPTSTPTASPASSTWRPSQCR
jgi:hypothetical protein